MGGNEVQIMWI